MENNSLIKSLKIGIWMLLGLIIFSPLYVNSGIFFPFIVTKTLVFNIAVELMFVLFLILAWRDSNYKINFNLSVGLLAGYILVITVASLLGNDFYRSFWSNNERSEGIILLVHLFLFLLVITSFLRRFKDWLWALDLAFFSSLLVSLVGFTQYFSATFSGFNSFLTNISNNLKSGLDFHYIDILMNSSGGSRLASSIGNAGYVGGYLIFAVFFGLILLFKRQSSNLALKIYYLAVIILNLLAILLTDTRGAWLAVLVCGSLFMIYLLFFYYQDKTLKYLGVALIILAIALPSILLLNKDADWVTDNRFFNRFASISFSDTTTRNRLMTWQSSIEGFQDKPILGWGYENFYQPFDKYYNPQIFRHAGSVVWFDRAHNVIFDRLITGGVLGLILYLSFLFAPFYFLWRNFLKKSGGNDKYFLPVTLSLAMLAYFIQNLFIFEALATYIPLLLVVGLVAMFVPKVEPEFIRSGSFKTVVLIIFALALVPAVYLLNIKPLQANLELTEAISSNDLTLAQRVNLFKRVLSQDNYGNQEYRKQMFEIVNQLAFTDVAKSEDFQLLLELAEQEMKKQIEENRYSVTNYLVAMRLNNLLFKMKGNLDKLAANEELFQQAKILAPNRQHLYVEVGYSYIYAGDYYQEQNKWQEAKSYYDQAVDYLKVAFELNPDNLEMYRQYLASLVFARDNEEIKKLISSSQLEVKLNKDLLIQLINTAIVSKNYSIIEVFANKLIEMDPNNPEYYVQLALSYAYQGKDQQAIDMAQKISQFGLQYQTQSEAFIDRIKAGEFKQK